MNDTKQTIYKKKPSSRINISQSYTSLIIGVFVVIVATVLVIGLIRRGGGDIIPTITPPAETLENMTVTEEEKTLPATYTVVEGDTLWSISEKFYKSGYNWVDIASENKLENPSSLVAGTKLTIPNVVVRAPAAPAAKETVSAPNAITGTEYIVVKDDNLWDIAVRAYGDGFKWSEIAKANMLVNPDFIHVGNKLTLPR